MNRSDSIRRLPAHPDSVDILIVGGGATGLSAALDAQSRGHSVVLVERHDFAKGSSSRSTKLVHGGVRYLRQGNISLVRDALRERALLLRNAPHLVKSSDFIIPCSRRWEVPYYLFGLKIYDLLAGKLGMAPSRSLSASETMELLPGLGGNGLKGGVVYQDCQFDDTRLALTLALTATSRGAILLNYFRCDDLLKEGDRVTGVRASDLESGRVHEIRARCVINATGVFVDALRGMDDPAAKPLVSQSQGVHLVLPATFLPGDRALMVPKTDDGRVFFAVPWNGRIIVGTTDTLVPRVELEPRPLEEEISFLLRHAARFLARKPSACDVLSVYTGLRPLVNRSARRGRSASISRDHFIQASESGMITITGGKWTTCRKMAEDVIDVAEQHSGLPRLPCITHNLPLHGSGDDLPPTGDPLRVYGTDASRIHDLLNKDPDLARPLHPRLPVLRAEVVWQARHEMARSVEDVLARRTRCLTLDARASAEVAKDVGFLLADALGWTAAQRKTSVEEFLGLASASVIPHPSLPSTPSPSDPAPFPQSSEPISLVRQ